MRFMLDENVANSVSKFLKSKGFVCEYIRDLLPAGSVDPLVAFVAQDYEAILVSHDGDFQKIAPRIPNGQKTRFKKLSRVHLSCLEHNAAQRFEKAFSLILLEYEIAQNSKDKRMNLVIGDSFIKSNR